MSKDCYKCDYCGDLWEGSPEIKITLFAKGRPTHWLGHEKEVCGPECARAMLHEALDSGTIPPRRAS